MSAPQTLEARRRKLDAVRTRSRLNMATDAVYRHEVPFTPAPHPLNGSGPMPGRSMGQPAYIYALVDPRTRQMRYIGRTVDLRRRPKDHSGDSRRDNAAKADWLDGLDAAGCAPQAWYLDAVLPRRAVTWECLYIGAALDASIPLLNQVIRIASDWDGDWAFGAEREGMPPGRCMERAQQRIAAIAHALALPSPGL